MLLPDKSNQFYVGYFNLNIDGIVRNMKQRKEEKFVFNFAFKIILIYLKVSGRIFWKSYSHGLSKVHNPTVIWLTIMCILNPVTNSFLKFKSSLLNPLYGTISGSHYRNPEYFREWNKGYKFEWKNWGQLYCRTSIFQCFTSRYLKYPKDNHTDFPLFIWSVISVCESM